MIVCSLIWVGISSRKEHKRKKIVKIHLSEDGCSVKSYDEFVTYIGDGPASPCGLSFGPGGLYFTDLHGEKKDVKIPSGNIYRVKPIEKELGLGVPNIQKNRRRCICPNCPSYYECMESKMEELYCAVGMSAYKIEKKDCICGECPVASEYGISGFYFCERGKVG